MANQLQADEPLLTLGMTATKETGCPPSDPPTYTPGPSQCITGPSHYTSGFSPYSVADPSQHTPYTRGPPQYIPGPQYTPGSSQYAPGPSQYAPGPSQYTPGPSQYTPGPAQYGPSQPQYPPYQQSAPLYSPCSQQQSSTNVAVVNLQPSAAPSTIVVRSRRDHYLTLSIIMTILCVLCIGCGWPSLLCTIPAIIVSVLARNDEDENHVVAAKKKASVSVCLNITSVIVFVLVIIAQVVVPIVYYATAIETFNYNWPTATPSTTTTFWG